MPVTASLRWQRHPQLPAYPITTVIFIMETGFFANRALWHITMSGVFERFPTLKLVLTEQGSAWVVDVLARMDSLHERMIGGRIGELGVPEEAVLHAARASTSRPTCGSAPASPTRPTPRCSTRSGSTGSCGAATTRTTRARPRSPRSRCGGRSPTGREADLRTILAENAAKVYGFDLAALAPLAAEYGPSVEQIATPLETIPDGAVSPAFA